jgi:hypothetical protein
MDIVFMKKYFKQHANLSRGAMETGDHSKNGASPKSQTSRENISKISGKMKTVKTISFLVAVITITLFMQSCAMVNLNERYALLSNDISVVSTDIQGALILRGADQADQEVIMDATMTLGIGIMSKGRESATCYSFAFGGIRYFSKKRLQPFWGYDLQFTGSKIASIGHVTPYLGLRYFVSPKVSLIGNVGYLAGYGGKFQHGVVPSMGIGFSLF